MSTEKLSQLKAAAIAATPGPWGSVYDDWSDGDDALISSESRDGMVAIAKIEGGGPDSGYDEPFGTEQQANTAFIAAANPAVVLELLAELEAKDKRIAELEEEFAFIMGQNDGMEKELRDKDARIEHLEAKLATPVRLPDTRLIKVGDTVVANREAQPVAWLAIYHGEVYDEAIGIIRSVVEAQADRFGWESALTEIIPLYRHAPPAPAPAPAMVGELLEAMEEVIRISDRDHDAWNRVKVAITACRGAILPAPHETDPIDVFVAQVCGDISAGHQR